MMHGATVAAAAFIAFALFATDCAASGPPAGTDPAPGGAFAERFDHAPLTAPRVDVVRAPQKAAPAGASRAADTVPAAQPPAGAAATAGQPPVADMPAADMPAADMPVTDVPFRTLPAWDVRVSDGTIRGVLSRWANTAGWQLVWDAPVDFSIDAQATLRGSFEDALQALVASLGRTSTPIQAILYRGNHVLRVVAQGAG
ncbi:toxin co-regulated pilus biosynthesis Q family protein [Burkholderia pseudomallei]|uniref:toxin co-regulated pilus biosynthesis Q family protein n=1 Tax=Burkholderia pseudomallei TaxID=28450 RepID=UPI000F081770|nr:toxin co-regulated pilus biosynthesis Q family protein [Burkholderia pseudomallei]CAJ2982203.1 PilL domain-containing protein [Burkholderia pseudomallei]CAJ6295321.1 PilL domain-containing protein [Burkholderia pseudomallei]VBF49577.1 PilL domain-containing protein [Burkholderia pseudomallei]VBQ57349.1 PilL domain-containing protein [Burkholderia pseudomallei]VCE82532.1 PilL domain-containing protein [Burkholderia pseudomallei]